MTTNDLCAKQVLGVPTKTISVPFGVPNAKCATVHQRYQNSLGMTPGVLKCNWCTKRNDCTKRTEDDQEWSYCATIRFCALLHVLLNESTFCPLKFKMAHGRHIENRNRYCCIFLFSDCILGFDEWRLSYRILAGGCTMFITCLLVCPLVRLLPQVALLSQRGRAMLRVCE